MVKLCEYQTCRNRASYAYTYDKAERCKEHKEDRKPQYNICMCGSASPSFNYEGAVRGAYCKKCKTDDMKNFKSNQCYKEGCQKRPIFNFSDKNKGKYCSKHKLKGMINVCDKKCKEEGCMCIPSFNFSNKKIGLYCSEHKLENMINIVSKKCRENGCQIIPKFNYANEKIGLYCSKHKLENMINVKGKRCQELNCDFLNPRFNYPNEKIGLYCNQHKKEKMINVIDKRCSEQNCKIINPKFNYKNEKVGIYCNQHKKEKMINVIDKKCPNCIDWIDSQRANKKYKNYCTRCFQQLFPNDPLTFQIRCKTKEIATRDYINANFDGFVHDKPLFIEKCNCVQRRRIDHRKLIGNTLLCIETDEFKHNHYDPKDEEDRYHDIYVGAHSGKLIFIRFNPDSYKDKNNKRKNPSIAIRLLRLEKEIEKHIKRIENGENKELLEIIKLYYDGFE